MTAGNWKYEVSAFIMRHMSQTKTGKADGWQEMLRLSSGRQVLEGSSEALVRAIGAGADLRVGTEFRHNEHIDVNSPSNELIRETMYFPVTYLVEERWTAGICTLRQPVSLPDGFGPRPSMSFFLYNQDGRQAIARPYLDGVAAGMELGAAAADEHPRMPKYHQFDNWDVGTNAPSHNFIYDFDHFRFFARGGWREILRHGQDGRVEAGSVDELIEAFSCGMDVKVGIEGLCDDLAPVGQPARKHTVFCPTIACYYYTERKLFITASQPVVRVRADVPMEYASKAWDFGWLVARSDGLVSRLLYDPYTLRPERSERHCAMRWFVR